jgi:hypothetical protein
VDNGLITAIIEENPNDQVRKSEIIVTGIDVDDIKLTVTQEGKVNSVPDPEELSNVKVFPNPFKDKVYISYELNNQSNVQVELIDVLGQTVDKQDLMVQSPGQYQYSLNAPESGKNAIYFIRVTVNDSVKVFKVLSVN